MDLKVNGEVAIHMGESRTLKQKFRLVGLSDISSIGLEKPIRGMFTNTLGKVYHDVGCTTSS